MGGNAEIHLGVSNVFVLQERSSILPLRFVKTLMNAEIWAQRLVLMENVSIHLVPTNVNVILVQS